MSEAVAPARLLNDEGRADSPFARFPGYVLFPAVMGLEHYKFWMKAQEQARQELLNEDSDPDKLRWMFRLEPGTNGNSDKKQQHVVNFSHYEWAQTMIEEWKLEGVARDEQNMPIPIVHWLIECLEEWLDTQLSFRVHGGGSMAQPES